MPRHKTVPVSVGNVRIGGENPVAIQSMTNTDTADAQTTVQQILELEHAGSEIMRLTVNNDDAARAVPRIVEKVRRTSTIPIVGDFHFNGNILLQKFPDCAASLDKYRINPGNADQKNFREMIETALTHNKPIRIGVNAGSVNRSILDDCMKKNGTRKSPLSSDAVLEEAVVSSTITSAQEAEKLGMKKNRLVLSAKMSSVHSVISVYRTLAKKSDYCLHLGLTEAGSDTQGIVQSSIALGILLNEGIGDTIRVSLTPSPSVPRTQEVEVCRQILQSLDLRHFSPRIISCPGCGRTSNEEFQKLVLSLNTKIVQQMKTWRTQYPGSESLRIAIMGCVVNGPGESSHADIGISFPGKTEAPFASVFVAGMHFCDLKGENIDEQFLEILEEFIKHNNVGT
ncbi:flavodoxin-dependent (E)-4-hydroxy-3-methylbut-2-enyl-diphosphate synthase [Candidatus Gracilibacteria bacterium]|nr:flavodoxin-dependent (E)-4-hydroxy-3-methylbut-2-enyl-diphosphate synthase [Candidatus Gracilibacteria bacterium]